MCAPSASLGHVGGPVGSSGDFYRVRDTVLATRRSMALRSGLRVQSCAWYMCMYMCMCMYSRVPDGRGRRSPEAGSYTHLFMRHFDFPKCSAENAHTGHSAVSAEIGNRNEFEYRISYTASHTPWHSRTPVTTVSRSTICARNVRCPLCLRGCSVAAVCRPPLPGAAPPSSDPQIRAAGYEHTTHHTGPRPIDPTESDTQNPHPYANSKVCYS